MVESGRVPPPKRRDCQTIIPYDGRAEHIRAKLKNEFPLWLHPSIIDHQNSTVPVLYCLTASSTTSTIDTIIMTESTTSTTAASSLYCNCNQNASCCKECGKPMANRDDTKAVVQALHDSARPPRSNVFGNGPLLLSDIPKSVSTNEAVVLGIDEAGRGCVLGPMVYGMAYWSASVEESSIPKGFQDSKALTEETRFRLFDELLACDDIGFGMRSLLPSEISRNMLRQEPYNLNQMSHDATIILIRKLIDVGKVNVTKCFIDTVGNPASYQRKLEQEFPGVEFVVESKADANYAPCSAASVGKKKCLYVCLCACACVCFVLCCYFFQCE
jgi:ribonuclease H